jgi:hypothetical protein
MHDIAQKQIFFKKLPELDPDPDLVVKFPDPEKRSGSGKKVRIRIRNTDHRDAVIEQQIRRSAISELD